MPGKSDLFDFGLFFIKGTDDQQREIRSFWNHFQSISQVKMVFLEWFLTNLQHFRFSDSNSDHSETISNRFLMSKLVYRMIFDQFEKLWKSIHKDSFAPNLAPLPHSNKIFFFIYIDISFVLLTPMIDQEFI